MARRSVMPCRGGRVRIPFRLRHSVRPILRFDESVQERSTRRSRVPGGIRRATCPAARAVLAVRRSPRSADARRAREPRSRSARSAVRKASAALLVHDRVSSLRGARLRGSASRWRARRRNIAKPGRATRSGTGRASIRATLSPCGICTRSCTGSTRATSWSMIVRCLMRASSGFRSRGSWPSVPEPLDVERDLRALDAALRKLEAEYNMYFAGRLPRPPIESRKRVQQLVTRLDRAYIQNYADRFRFNTLQARFSSFTDLWDRGLKSREEGRHGPFAPPRREEPPPATARTGEPAATTDEPPQRRPEQRRVLQGPGKREGQAPTPVRAAGRGAALRG